MKPQVDSNKMYKKIRKMYSGKEYEFGAGNENS